MVPASPLQETFNTRVAAASVGPHRYLTLPHLIRLFQEAALVNTDRLGISSERLTADHGLTWVLHRQVVDAERWPRLGDRVTVLTLPTHIERRLVSYRDFYLLDAKGHPIVRSTTAWSLMSLDARRIRPIPVEVSDRLAGLPPAGQHLTRPGDKPDPPGEPAAERTSRVTFAHLDFNNHLTNPAFPELMLEPLGAPFLSTHLPRHADITYHREARYGDYLTARSSAPDAGDAVGHALYRDESELLAAMASRWTPLL
ncbi:acyl-[acyl-carrier-protein] thioesterase [Lewinella sp. IMCC34183]|uniref:acyl-[acyl-carrier-protein] thioesterase n=1 Tax=Lewinella sp. IMCC34183 TaxID=2248762 RepID=UPI00130069AF|nr:acyl-ACP thioesterase domain-containing protein [Lewinella sp. IMCC34183]